MSAAKRQVALLGAGYIAKWHAEALRLLPEVEIVAVCDRSVQRAEALARQYSIKHAYGSLNEMLGAHKLDVVHVLVPPDHHFSSACLILEAGVNVFLEKPMCTTPAECGSLNDKAQQKGLALGVNHNYLFHQAYQSLRKDMSKGELGRVEQVIVTRNCELEVLRTGPFGVWMLREPQNIMLEIGPHSVGQVLDLIGPPDTLTVDAFDPMELPGHHSFFLRWLVHARKGAVSVELRYSFRLGFSEDTIHVRGTSASATADLQNNTYIRHHHTKYLEDIDRYLMATLVSRSLRRQARRNLMRYALSKFKLCKQGNAYGESIARSIRAFYSELPSCSDPRISGSFGLHVVGWCEKIGRLARPEVLEPAAPKSGQRSAGPGAGVLVIGGAGFIGRHLVRRLLADGHSVRVLTRNPQSVPPELDHESVEVRGGDIMNPSEVEDALRGTKCVFHLAVPHATTWSDYYDQHVVPTRQLAEACLKYGVKRLMYTGTIASYYTGGSAGTITERTPLDPRIRRRDNYARAKAEAESTLLAMHREKGLPVVIFRPGIVLGSGGNPFHWGIGMWSHNSICQLWGAGTNKLPIVLVEDVATALAGALHTENIDGESFNLAAPPCLTAREYLEEFERCAGVRLTVIPTPIWKFYAADLFKWIVKCLVRHPERRVPSYRDWESRTLRAVFDCSKARDLLGWEPVSDPRRIAEEGIQIPVAQVLGPRSRSLSSTSGSPTPTTHRTPCSADAEALP